MKYHAIPKGSVAIPIHVHDIEVQSETDYEPLLPTLVTIDGIKGNPFKRYAMVTPDTIYYCPCGEVSVTETSGGRKHFQNCMQMKERQQAVKNKQLSASGGDTIGGVTVRFVPVKDRNLELRSVMEQEMFSTMQWKYQSNMSYELSRPIPERSGVLSAKKTRIHEQRIYYYEKK